MYRAQSIARQHRLLVTIVLWSYSWSARRFCGEMYQKCRQWRIIPTKGNCCRWPRKMAFTSRECPRWGWGYVRVLVAWVSHDNGREMKRKSEQWYMQCRSDRVERLEAEGNQFCHLEGCYRIMHAYSEAQTGWDDQGPDITSQPVPRAEGGS